MYRFICSRKLVLALLLAGTTFYPAQGAAAPKKEPGKIAEQPNKVTGTEITPEQQRAVERGLEFLASKQQVNGSYSSPGITALAGLAFMSAGNTPGRGTYGDNVRRCLESILANTRETGVIAAGREHGAMYGHGFATLFLGEVYGMTHDEEMKEKLQKAVRLIQRTQNPQGGWRYTPEPHDADISVTICEIMALRAAADAGIRVDKRTMDNAVKYVRNCQNPDGGFSYQAGSSGSAFPRSAAGVAALYYAGIFEGNDLKRGLEYLKQQTKNIDQAGGGFFFYGHYYASQAMFLAGGDYWATYYPAIREHLIKRQNKSTGAWSGEQGDDYATSMALIILQMPHRYLPVFHGKGPGS